MKPRLPLRASEMKAPPGMPVALPRSLDERSHLGCGDSHHQPAADHQAGIKILQEKIRHSLCPIRYLEPTPWNLPPCRTDPPSQEPHCSAQGRSLENSVGNSTHHFASHHTTSKVDVLDVFTGTDTASRDRVGLDPPAGSLFDCNALIPGSFLRGSSKSHLAYVRTNVTQGTQQVAISSSTHSIARGSPRMTPSGGYSHNRQLHGPSLLRSQRPTTAATIPSLARQATTQHGVALLPSFIAKRTTSTAAWKWKCFWWLPSALHPSSTGLLLNFDMIYLYVPLDASRVPSL